MAAALSDFLHHIASTNVVAFLRPRQLRRFTIHHVLIILCGSAVLSTLYYTYLKQSEEFSSSEDIPFWPPETPEIWADRAAQVKEAFRHAYHGYEQHAFPHDELLPVSNKSIDNFNGWGVTAVDSLDAMLLMGFKDEYTRALPMISHSNFSLSISGIIPFFETVIRHLGGLLAAYAISGHDLLLQKADELGSALAPAFHTMSGLPAFSIDTYTGKLAHNPSMPLEGIGLLAEIASCQLEYAYLGKITGKQEHVEHATMITNVLYNAVLSRSGGMYPTLWNLNMGAPSNRSITLSVGAFADSGHEYTLKQFLLTARTDKRNLEMYLRFTSYVINNLLFLTPDRHLLYVTDASVLKRAAMPTHNFEHLSCFFPGLLALGVHLLPLDHLDTLGIDVAALADDLFPVDRQAYADLSEFNLADLHLWAAEGIAQTCYLTYADQPTGLGPETVRMEVDQHVGGIRWMDELHAWKEAEDRAGAWWRRGSASGYTRAPPGVHDIKPWMSPLNESVAIEPLVRPESARGKGKPLSTFGRNYYIKNSAYLLRPETIESLYILWRTTGDVKWRHRGWDIFRAIERYAKTDSGYTNVEYVHTARPMQTDSMPSYFLAETLKYLYLLFLDEDPLPLEKWVFTTEAHALPVFEWSKEEREAYGIV